MKIIITKNCLATHDGFTLKRFEAGEVADLGEFCAKNLVRNNEAVFWQNDLQAAFIKASLPPKPVKQEYATPLEAAIAQLEKTFPKKAVV